jgi:hypothetical protein
VRGSANRHQASATLLGRFRAQAVFRRVCLCLALAALSVAPATLGTAATQQVDARDRAVAGSARAKELIEAAVAALGGERYLSVKAIASRGVFTGFSQGRPGAPVDFVDTTILPDKGRTEFGKKKNRIVQANAGDRGWKYDGPRGALTPQSPDEVRAFQFYVRGNLDNVLRTSWRGEGVRLRYLGRTEWMPRQWTEGVAMEYPDGFRVEILFDPATKLPIVSRYHEGAGSGASGSLLEARYHFFIDFGGVKVPRFVDLYRDGVQTARVVNDTVDLNPVVPPNFFDQPASIAGFR